VTCYACHAKGHYARDCKTNPRSEEALVTYGRGEDSDAENESAYMTTEVQISHERALFATDEVLIDSQASVNIFHNRLLLRNIRRSQRSIVLNGVKTGASGVAIDQEGDFNELGPVFYSEEASANILSLAQLVDSGCDVRYEHEFDKFSLRPPNSTSLYSFCRKDVTGSEGRFYECNLSTMIETSKVSEADAYELILVQTVEGNMKRYSKREVGGATRAREMLSRMGYPSVQHAIAMVESGTNFDITAHDFRIAEAIWGPDIASMKGKTRKMGAVAADMVIAPVIVQQDQVLAIDIMFVEGVAVLVGLASPLGLTMAATMSSFDTGRGPRSATVIKSALEGFIATLASRNFKTRLIMTDGEGAVGKLTPALNMLGIEVDISGAGGHVPTIERKIQVIEGCL
jgi:hypothetical protein